MTKRPLCLIPLALLAGSALAQTKTLYIGMNGGTMEKAYTEHVFPAFEKANNAKVVVVPGTSSDILAKAQANKDKPQMHVMFLDDGVMYRAIGLGLCEKQKPSPVLNDLYPSAHLKGDMATGVSLGMTGLAYNKKLFAEKGWAAPTSWMDLADRGSDLEARAGKAEGVDEAGRRCTEADHRLVVGQVALGAAPAADHAGAAQRGQEFQRLVHRLRDGIARGARALVIQRIAAAAADHAIAALHLAAVDATAFDAEAQVHEQRQRLSDGHDRVAGRHRHRLAKLLGNAAGPRAGAVEQEARAHLESVVAAQQEVLAVARHLDNACLLAHVGAERTRRTRERG